MNNDVLLVHGPESPQRPLVLDSPHSGRRMPGDFGAAVSEFELRDGEDCFVDELYLPAAQRGVPLLAAQFARTYLDPNRHAADIDLDLLDAAWPHEHVQERLAACGYDVKVNDPFKGAELISAYCDPAAGRHSLQIEVNKRLYMDEAARERHAGFERLQADLMDLLDAICERFAANARAA